jgi:hypothetical protein
MKQEAPILKKHLLHDVCFGLDARFISSPLEKKHALDWLIAPGVGEAKRRDTSKNENQRRLVYQNRGLLRFFNLTSMRTVIIYLIGHSGFDADIDATISTATLSAHLFVSWPWKPLSSRDCGNNPQLG